MASIHQDKRSKNWIVCFRWEGKQYRKSCRTELKSAAIAVKARVEETIRMLELGRLNIPKDVDVSMWILSDGKTRQRPQVTQRVPTISSTYDACFKDQIDKAKSTLTGEAVHIKHLKRVLGGSTSPKNSFSCSHAGICS